MWAQQQVTNGPAFTHITVHHPSYATHLLSEPLDLLLKPWLHGPHHIDLSVRSDFQPGWGATDVADPGKELQNRGVTEHPRLGTLKKSIYLAGSSGV